MQAAVGDLMDGNCDDSSIAALLMGLSMKGETATEIAGAASAMRERSSKITTTRTGLIDTCGTGGDELHTFNISTATAIVVAATGQPVAKHGNRSVSSSSGSSDVLERLGVNIELTADVAGMCLDEIGICFCYARLFHSAMKHVAPIRQQLGFRTIFNLLGPLTNPAQAEFQLLGTNRDETAQKLAQAANELGTNRTFVVCGNNQLDEVSLWGTTRIWDVQNGSVNEIQWTAADFGLAECTPDELRVSSPEESAAVIRDIFNGTIGPHRDMVVANTAAALICSGRVSSPQEAAQIGQQTLDSGAAMAMLEKLASWTQNAKSNVELKRD